MFMVQATGVVMVNIRKLAEGYLDILRPILACREDGNSVKRVSSVKPGERRRSRESMWQQIPDAVRRGHLDLSFEVLACGCRAIRTQIGDMRGKWE
jgi:hypothetical protein